MAMNIVTQELRMLLKSVIAWSVAIAVLLLVFSSLFSSFAEQAVLLNDMMANFPPQLLLAFGLTGIDLSTVLGYFGFIFLFIQLCLAIQAASYGFSMVSIEEREWTADFLLSKPVGRSRILTSKLIAVLCALLLTDLVVWISAVVCLSLFSGDKAYDAGILLVLLASVVVFQLFFLAVGLVISLLVKRVRSVVPYAMALGFGMYVLSVFGDMLGDNMLEKITPFKHFDAHTIVMNGTWDWPLVMISVVVIVISLAGSYVLYTRRDIPAVV